METATITPEITVEVGDLFESSWGYDQTNVSYYEVTGFTPSGKSVRLRKIRKAGIEGSDGFMSRKVKPVPGEFVGEEFTKLLLKSPSRYRESPWYLKFESYDYPSHIKRADAANTSHYESWYA